MGRSVSYATGSIAKAYLAYDLYETDEETGEEVEVYINWDEEVDTYRAWFKDHYPSLEACDKWLGDEDHAIAENSFAYFGISEYCGLVCLWVVPKAFDTWYADEARKEALALAWCNQIKDKFERTFGEYVKVGTFSNGEGIYHKIVRYN